MTSQLLVSANYGDSSLTLLAIDPATGDPTVVGNAATADVPLRVVAHPTSRIVFSIERSELESFVVDPIAGLLPSGSPVVLSGDYPMAARVSGGLLLVTYYGGSTGASVRSFAISSTGGLAELDRCVLGSTSQPVDVIADASGRFAYVADSTGSAIVTLAVEQGTGKLALASSVACTDVSALALDASGAFLVALTSASPGIAQVFAVGANGDLVARGGPFGTGPHSALAIELGPNGRFYIVTANSALVVATIDAQGNLATASTTHVPAVGFPCALALDLTGAFVYTANFAGDDLSVLQLGSTITPGSNVRIAPRNGGSSQPSWLAVVR